MDQQHLRAASLGFTLAAPDSELDVAPMASWLDPAAGAVVARAWLSFVGMLRFSGVAGVR